MQNLREQFLQETKHKATNVAGKLTDKYAKWLETKIGEQSRQAAVSGRSEQFYCADWNRCGSICEEQCNACNKAENMPEVAQ